MPSTRLVSESKSAATILMLSGRNMGYLLLSAQNSNYFCAISYAFHNPGIFSSWEHDKGSTCALWNP